MNELKLDIGQESKTTDQTLHLFIDGTEIRRIIFDNGSAAFFPELAESAKKSGNYLILTCWCGVADCAGWDKVNVVHKDNLISWAFSYNGHTFEFFFDNINYTNEIQKIQERIESENILLHPGMVVDPE
jgi:hypothetical protein